MKMPLEVTYRGLEKSESMETVIRRRAGKLDQICHDLISCRVAVEQPQRHQEAGSPYRIRIQMRVPPGHELVVRRETTEGDMHDPPEKVIRLAFDAAQLALQKQMELERHEVKHHPAEEEHAAIVDRLFQEQGYGYIRTRDGREYYFHRNSVLHDDFERLAIGTGVRFMPEIGLKGPQASSVQILSKPGGQGSAGEAGSR